MKLQNKKSFTLIETILSFTGLSIVTIGIGTILSFQNKHIIINENENIFEKLSINVEESINQNYKLFLYSKFHIMEPTIVSNTNLGYDQISGFTPHYSYRQVMPFISDKTEIIDTAIGGTITLPIDTDTEKEWKIKMWHLDNDLIKKIKNYSLMIVDKISNYKGIKYLYVDAYIVDFTKMQTFNNLTTGVKTCLFRYRDNITWDPSVFTNNYYNNLPQGPNDTYYLNETRILTVFGESGDTSKIDADKTHAIFPSDDIEGYSKTSNNIECKTIMKNFIDDNLNNNFWNVDAWGGNSAADTLSTNPVDGYISLYHEIVTKLVKFKRVSNYKTVEREIDKSLKRFNSVYNNIVNYNNIENINNGFLNLKINNYYTCYKDVVSDTCQFDLNPSSLSYTERLNNDGNKIIYANSLDYYGTLYKNMKIKNVNNIILVGKRSSFSGTPGNTTMSSLFDTSTSDTGSTYNSVDVLDQITTETSRLITVNGFTQLEKFHTTGNKEYKTPVGTNEPNNIFIENNYKMFGTTVKNSATEILGGVPFYFSNVNNSSITIAPFGSTIIEDLYFKIRPSIEKVFPNEVIKENGPFSSIMIMVFPWIYSIFDSKELSEKRFGVYSRELK